MTRLTRISHQLSTAATDSGAAAALRSIRLLDIVSTMPAGPNLRAPCIRTTLRRLATISGEKYGLRLPAEYSSPDPSLLMNEESGWGTVRRNFPRPDPSVAMKPLLSFFASLLRAGGMADGESCHSIGAAKRRHSLRMTRRWGALPWQPLRFPDPDTPVCRMRASLRLRFRARVCRRRGLGRSSGTAPSRSRHPDR